MNVKDKSMSRMIVRQVLHIMLISMTMYCVHAFADVNDAATKIKWGYEGKTGPQHWGQLDSAFAVCANGQAQSPINITKETIAKNTSLTLHYKAAPMLIVDDGLTELMIGKTQTIFNDGHAIQLNFAQDAEEKITYNDKSYWLVQFHIHTPSENKWQGQSFPMEIHFVHQGEDGTLAVIGVFVRNGKENPVFKKIVAHLPKREGDIMTVKGENINPADLIPVRQDYYSFAGSLTTPPCLEGVQWLVMAEPITASAVQIAKLKRAINGENARPVQALHGRQIWSIKK